MIRKSFSPSTDCLTTSAGPPCSHRATVFAPHSKLRAAVTPAHRGQGAAQYAAADPAQPPTPRHVAMSWAPRLKLCREFVEAANKTGGKAEMVMLADVGLPGASHMLMQDRHSLKIGAWLADWIDRNTQR